MIVIPAIDFARSDSSPAQAIDRLNEWGWMGFSWAQLGFPADQPDAGTPAVLDWIEDLRLNVQVASLASSGQAVDALLEAGVARVVLGSRALDQADWLETTAGAFPGRLIVESPLRERRVRSRGWTRTLPIDLRDLAADLSSLPLAALSLTLDDSDETTHRDLSLIEDVVESLPFPVQITGGHHSLGSLRDLEFRGVDAAVIDGSLLAQIVDEQTLARTFVEPA